VRAKKWHPKIPTLRVLQKGTRKPSSLRRDLRVTNMRILDRKIVSIFLILTSCQKEKSPFADISSVQSILNDKIKNFCGNENQERTRERSIYMDSNMTISYDSFYLNIENIINLDTLNYDYSYKDLHIKRIDSIYVANLRIDAFYKNMRPDGFCGAGSDTYVIRFDIIDRKIRNVRLNLVDRCFGGSGLVIGSEDCSSTNNDSYRYYFTRRDTHFFLINDLRIRDGLSLEYIVDTNKYEPSLLP